MSFSKSVTRFSVVLFGTVCCAIVPDAVSQSSLDADLQELYDKYGRDSVVRKVIRDNPKPAAAAEAQKVPEDAFASEAANETNAGFRVFKEQPFPILIRRSYSDVAAGEDPSIADPKTLREAEGAQFSYSYDYQTNSSQWSAVGALIAPIKVYKSNQAASQSALSLEQLNFVPSVSLNRVTNDKDESKEVDEVTFRAGLFSRWLGIAGPLRLVKLSGYASYATDSSFDNGIVAGEFDLEPITNAPGNRTFHPIGENGSGKTGRSGSLIEFHWRAHLHTELGDSVGDGRVGSSADRGEFFRIGPVVALQLDPFFLQRLRASIDYGYLVGVSGSPSASHDLRAKLSLILDPNLDTQHWSLGASYQDGETPLVQERIHTFLLSLDVKY
jgi:hypothetical protein